MHVLHINRNYLGTNLHQLMIGKLSELGVQSDVFVPVSSLKGPFPVTPADNVHVSRCFTKLDRYFYYLKQRKIIRAVEKQYPVDSFDLIHAYTVFTDGNAARALAKKYGKKYVVAVRNVDVNSFFQRVPFLRPRGVRIMRHAERVFFLSPAYRDAVLQKYVPSRYREEILSKSEICPNGIDAFWLSNKYDGMRSPAPSDLHLLYAGKIVPGKNIPAILEAMRLLRKRGIVCRLTVVGKAEDKSLYERLVSDPDTVCLPAMPKEQLIDVYRANDIFVMPSFYETFGLVYPEAMSQGLPVVYSRGQGFDRQFPEGEVGFSCDPHDPETIASAVEKILSDYSAFSGRCTKRVDTFNWTDIAGRYLRFYEEALED